jgi:hypothetical protein
VLLMANYMGSVVAFAVVVLLNVHDDASIRTYFVAQAAFGGVCVFAVMCDHFYAATPPQPPSRSAAVAARCERRRRRRCV